MLLTRLKNSSPPLNVSASAVVPPTPMNRTLRALHPINTEGNLSAPVASNRFADVMEIRAKASTARVTPTALTMAEDLRRANPSISLEEAKRLYPSIPLDGGNAQDAGRMATGSMAAGSDGVVPTRNARVVLIEEEDNGLPIYTHPSPPLGPVRELTKNRLENPPFEDVLCVGIPVDFQLPKIPNPFRFLEL